MEGGNIKAAIDTCMDLNHWDIGMDLAMNHDPSQNVESSMVKYTTCLQEFGNSMHTVQVLIKGGQQLEAAKILVQFALQMAEIKVICSESTDQSMCDLS